MFPTDIAELDRVCRELDDLRPRDCITASAWGESGLVRIAERGLRNREPHDSIFSRASSVETLCDNEGMAATDAEGTAPKCVLVNAGEPCPIAHTEVTAGKTAQDLRVPRGGIEPHKLVEPGATPGPATNLSGVREPKAMRAVKAADQACSLIGDADGEVEPQRTCPAGQFNFVSQSGFVSSAAFPTPTSLANQADPRVDGAPVSSVRPALSLSSLEVKSYPRGASHSPPGGLDVRQAFPLGRWSPQPNPQSPSA